MWWGPDDESAVGSFRVVAYGLAVIGALWVIGGLLSLI